MIRVLGLSSSPRRGGNTDLLLDGLLQGVRDAAAQSEGVYCEIEKLMLADLRIEPCSQCDKCQGTGICPVQDDMQPIYKKLIETDSLVLASPIYFMAHCAQAKIVIDRCQALWSRRHILKQPLTTSGRPTRRGIFVSVGATHGPKVFAGAKVTMKWFLEALDMEYWGNLLFEGIEAKGAVRDHPSALQEAYTLGGKLVSSYMSSRSLVRPAAPGKQGGEVAEETENGIG